jgi:hypothetical protein
MHMDCFLSFSYKIIKHQIFFFHFFGWPGALAESVSFKSGPVIGSE